MITGITGLLGQHLLIDALRRRDPVVVMSRSKPGLTAYERVDELVTAYECRFGVLLERPIVIEGDLAAPGLGMSADDINWCRRNVHSIIHSAASVKFRETKSGEPTRTNFEGTKQLLEMFEHSSLRHFHHISTAYSCGAVDDGKSVAEVLHPLATTFRNVYEESKCRAEHLVKSAPGEFERSIYRPSIIVGHSSTGYSPSFNALYKPMQLVWLFIREFPLALDYSAEWLNRFGIGVNDSRNVVPVDWVSAAITALVHRKDARGEIFHLTNSKPVLNCEIIAAMVEVLRRHVCHLEKQAVKETALVESIDALNDQLDVYRAYFSVDPIFENSNLNRIESCPSSPKIGHEELVKMFSYAAQVDFKNEDFRGNKRTRQSAHDFFEQLATEFRPSDVSALAHKMTRTPALESQASSESIGTSQLGLVISGPGGGRWQLRMKERQVICSRPVEASDCESMIYVSAGVFENWLRGVTPVEQMLRTGAFVLIGSGADIDWVREILLSLRDQISRLTEKKGDTEFNVVDDLRVALVAGSVRHDV